MSIQIDLEFNAEDFSISWSYNPDNDNTDLITDILASYQAEIWSILNDESSELKETYIITPNVDKGGSLTFTLAQNIAVFGVATRYFWVKVYAKDTLGELATLPTDITATNPSPSIPLGVVITTGVGVNFINITPSTDTDIQGYVVYRSATSGFTPGEGNKVYEGAETYITLSSDPDTVYYYRVAEYDHYGKVGLNISQEYVSSVPANLPAYVANAANTPSITQDITANRPAAGTVNRLFIDSTLKKWQRDTGSAWEDLGVSQVVPIASASVLGGIKIGANLTISEDGTLSTATGGGGSSDGTEEIDGEFLLVLNGEGENNSTNFVDECGSIVTPHGGAIISNDWIPYGNASIKFNGTSSYLTIPSSNKLNLSNRLVWAISCTFYANVVGTSNNQMLIDKDGVAGNSYPQYSLYISTDGKIGFIIGTGDGVGSINDFRGMTTITASTRHDVTVFRYGALLYVYLDGKLEMFNTITATMRDGGKPLYIGNEAGQPNWFNGYLKRVVICTNRIYMKPYTINNLLISI